MATRGNQQMASPLADYGSFSVKDSAVNSTIHLCRVRGVTTEAYEDKVRAIGASARVWPLDAPSSWLPGVEMLLVGSGGWDAVVGGLQQAESRSHRSVAVRWGWDYGDDSIKPLSDHAASRRAAAAADIWVLLRDTSGLSSWQQQLSRDARYQRL